MVSLMAHTAYGSCGGPTKRAAQLTGAAFRNLAKGSLRTAVEVVVPVCSQQRFMAIEVSIPPPAQPRKRLPPRCRLR